MPEPTTAGIVIAALIAFVAGLIDAMAGGGGIFTLPTVAAFGYPLPMVAGTNKLVGTTGSLTATLTFLAKGRIERPIAAVGAICAVAGSVGGAMTLVRLDQAHGTLTRGAFGILLVGMAIYMFLRPRFGGASAYEGLTRRNLGITIGAGLMLGFYDGFFGPGTGSFLVFVMVRWLRFDFVVGTGNAKAMNLGSNVGSLATFIALGLVAWPLALPMALANATGSYLGSRLAIAKGARFVRWAFLIAALGIAGRMGWFVLTGT
ncbi:MAG: sulfite exporter TauE/SafE family protein [Phycisphaerales bacterium]